MMKTTANLIFFSWLVLVVYAQFGVVIPSEDPTTGVTGTDVTLECEQSLPMGDDSAPNLTWEFNGANIVNDNKYSLTNKKNETAKHTLSILVIKDGQLSDNGYYSCRGDNSQSKVEVKLSLDATVKIVNVEGDFLLAEGTIMQCISDSPNTTLTWSKDGTDLKIGTNDLNKNGQSDLEVNDENEVVLLSADPILAGEYTCTGDLGTTTKSAFQTIAGELDLFAPKSIKVSEGEDGRMECRVTSFPTATVTWFVNDTEITPDDKYVITFKQLPEPDEIMSTLMIRRVTLEDGRPTAYNCSATNGVFTSNAEIILRIRDRLAALWPFIGIVSEVIILIVIILIHEACTKGEDIGEVEDDEEDHLLQKNRSITRDGERETRMRGTNN